MAFREYRTWSLTCDRLRCGEHFSVAAGRGRPMSAFEAHGWSITLGGLHLCPAHTVGVRTVDGRAEGTER